MAGKGQLAQGGELETVGVSVESHQFETGQGARTEVKLYDLAGQVDYYGLHQLFLTERALYVLVWDTSKFLDKHEALSDELKDWLATLHLRAPQSTVLLCGTHKDKCVPLNIFEKSLALRKRSPSIEKLLQEVETSVNQKHQEWKDNRREGYRNRDEELKLVSGIQLVSSSPTLHYGDSGLPGLQEKIKRCGTGTRWWIPPSWRLALVVLDAVRDNIDPVKAARHFVNLGHLPPPQQAKKCTWIAREDLSRHWETVQECRDIPAYLKADDREFTLESVLDLRESGGSLLQHPEVVFLDVEAFALSLAPILNHKTQQRDGRGAPIFGGRKLEEQWQLAGRELLVNQGILLTEFARFLWEKADQVLPKQTFDILVKLGILLPLPRYEPGAREVYSVGGESVPPLADVEKKFLVLMRLPLEASPETMARFEAFKKLQKDWGVVVKWEFDSGSTPHGLVERLVASCHSIGNVIQDTCWRRGACFVSNETSTKSAGGTFALALHFLENTVETQTGGSLVVRAFGHRESRAVWGALRFVISSAWRLFEEFPGLGWEAQVECPYDRQLPHYLAGVKDIQGRSPGDPILPPHFRVHYGCSRARDVALRLGKVLRTREGPWTSEVEGFVSEGAGRVGKGPHEAQDERFKEALGSLLNDRDETPAEEELAEDGRTAAEEGCTVLELLTNFLIAGPLGMLTLYETWSPLLEIADHWREGKYAYAILLTIFAVVLALAVVVAVTVGLRKLRNMCGRWRLRSGRDYSYEMVNMSDRV